MDIHSIYNHLFVPVCQWLGGIVGRLFPWPAIVVFALIHRPTRTAITGFANGLTDAATTIRTVKVAGIEFGLDAPSARRVAGSSTEIVVAAYKAAADEACRKAALRQKFERVIDDFVVTALKEIHNETVPHFRSTIHILDGVYFETFYQLVEYLHRPEGLRNVPSPATRGRRFSYRFGIFGRAWRLGASDYDPNVSIEPEHLIEKWGMTREEANTAGRGHKSFAVFLLRDSEHNPLGGIFIDSESDHLFGEGDRFLRLVPEFLEGAKKTGLVAALEAITATLAAANPQPIKKLS